MAVIIRSDFRDDKFLQDALGQIGVIVDEILDAYIKSGDAFIAEAKSQVQDHRMGTYIDDTTDLRTSIGYYVFRDGELVHQESSGLMDISEVRDMVRPKGIQLIGFAGMYYASYVESKGYNVISNQADVCMFNLSDFLEKARK
jgi:hypothetical protein